jgi:hypothetical protein
VARSVRRARPAHGAVGADGVDGTDAAVVKLHDVERDTPVPRFLTVAATV